MPLGEKHDIIAYHQGGRQVHLIIDTAGVADAAYRLATDGAFGRASGWQADLYELLSAPERDLGTLLLTPTGAGKVEAVVIPALGTHRGGAPRRVFLIGPDHTPLDDYLYRLVPYLKASVQGDETPRTLCLDVSDDDTQANLCRRFFPDGTEDPRVETNPLEADVDLVLTTFSRFRALFFGSGGIHALPSALAGPDGAPLRRDLFFFDEAHSYAPDAFAQFHRLVEFLFAEDMDVVVGSTTLPADRQEELSFLETIRVPPGAGLGQRTLTHVPSADPLGTMDAQIRRAYYQNARVLGVTETEAEAESLHARLVASYPHNVYLYHGDQEPGARRRIYAQLRELEKEGEGYLLLTTGGALETSDLDATVLFSTVCSPESLIRRAGRCNRRGDLPDAQVCVVGDALDPAARALPSAQADAYLSALRVQANAPFDAETWKAFI